MIGPDDFVAALPAQVAPELGDDVHLWRLPYAREMRRGPLLGLLAEYLSADPATLELRDDERGKPRLYVRGEAHCDVRFNWSHSGAMALVALARHVNPGVDIEQPRGGVKVLEIAQRFFAPAEADALASSEERDVQFYRLWCAKEAVLKALGRGLAFGLERVAFELRGECWEPARFDAEAGDPAGWQIRAFSPAPGCPGALAWRGAARAIQAWQPTGG